MTQKIERIRELTTQLNTYRNEYYNLGEPSVSDTVYDRLFDELAKLEKAKELGVTILTPAEFFAMIGE